MTCTLTRLFLGLSGLILLAIGSAVLLKPLSFAAANGIFPGNDPSLLSELRAPGGLLITGGIAILSGAVRLSMMRTGLMVTATIYGTYGLSRLVGIGFDGLPSDTLIQAMAIELLLATLSLVALVHLGSGSAMRRTVAGNTGEAG